MPEHDVLARKVAQRSVVMLKNKDSILPLKKAGQKISLIGWYCVKHCEITATRPIKNVLEDTHFDRMRQPFSPPSCPAKTTVYANARVSC